MELANLKSYQRTIASVDLPLKHFIETGFWNPYVVPGWKPNDIAEQQVRGACRKVAAELKRPFIRCHPVVAFGDWMQVDGKYKRVQFDQPRFEFGLIEVPKRQYLSPLVAPLLLAAKPATYREATPTVTQTSSATLWEFRISDRQLWDDYYQFVLTDPECRKARKLTS